MSVKALLVRNRGNVLSDRQMNQVSLIRVVVSSPSDVQQERDALSRVADELNRIITRTHDLRIEVNR
jgi:hypothetical protein